MGEYGIPLRRHFQKGIDFRTHNVHIYEQNNPEIDRHIKFRDWMITHPDDMQTYVELKRNLAACFNSDIFSYCLGKEDFIVAIDRKAGWLDFRFVRALTPREWHAAKYFRNAYFFDPHDLEELCIWTFDHEEHAHLVLYYGIEIVGYAHIQFFSYKRAAIRVIFVDEDKRTQNADNVFLSLIEKWLRSLDIKSVHAEPRQSILRFYLKNGYTEIPFNNPESHEPDLDGVSVGKFL